MWENTDLKSKGVFYKKLNTNFPGTWYHVLYHPPPTAAVVFLPNILFSNLQSFARFGIVKDFMFQYHWVLRVLFPEDIARDYSQLPRLFGRWAIRAVVPWRADLFVPDFGAAVSGNVGVWFRSSGGKCWSRWGNAQNQKICGGMPPQHVVKRGDP